MSKISHSSAKKPRKQRQKKKNKNFEISVTKILKNYVLSLVLTLLGSKFGFDDGGDKFRSAAVGIFVVDLFGESPISFYAAFADF